eukprot:TRINITY_DN6169_c0_g1_i1.p1 TRINITY_DN6169_c0_g1~~TRINITY_DN6169_c0_g1_i1.p1  ORF type:complete len:184 (+),score=50.66 TRINITY_DN6169_c0_g1_i1:199-750(+)
MDAIAQVAALQVPSGLRTSASNVARPSSMRVFAAPGRVACRRNVVISASSATAEGIDMEKLVLDIKSLTLEQARTLTDRLQEELGVSAAAMMPMGGGVAAPAAAEAAPVVEEKTEFDLVLEEVPSSSRIAVIKVVRALTGLGLKEAKDMIEGLPKKVKEAAAKEEVEEGLKQLEAAGAKASLK